MIDLDLDRSLLDLRIEDGDLVLVEGIEELKNACWTALMMHTDEYFLNLDAGTDHFGRILGQVSTQMPRAETRRVLRGVEGVDRVIAVRAEIDTQRRVRIEADIEYGQETTTVDVETG